MTDRGNSPVFVLGCHRSGTNLMYDTLVSQGGFAAPEAPLYVYEMLLPRFGDPARRAARERLADTWLGSEAFLRSGLERDRLEAMIARDCRSAGDFLRIVMGEIARRQGARRWAVWGPDNVFHMVRIKREIPDALFVHVIRDGRDVALALSRMASLGQRPPATSPWPRSGPRKRPDAADGGDSSKGTHTTLVTSALFWSLAVERARKSGQAFPKDYYEVHFEDLVGRRPQVLSEVGNFVGSSLDSRGSAAGTLEKPNTVFANELEDGSFAPVGRWKRRLSQHEVRVIEGLIGKTLKACGYALTSKGAASGSPSARIASWVYPRLIRLKLWMKYHTPFSRLVSLRGIHPGPSVAPGAATPKS